MKLFEKLLSAFNRNRNALRGSVDQPNDLASYINLIHTMAFRKITGKSPMGVPSNLKGLNALKDISPAKRILRRGI